MPDLSVYHSQQCAEKSLKAFLTYKLQPIEKTHDLNILVNLCQNFEPNFKNLISRASYLNGFDTKYRYPNDELEPSDIETREALNYASEILEFVSEIIKTEIK